MVSQCQVGPTAWAKPGVVGDLKEVAAKEGWDKTVPTALQKFSKFNGKWIAAPVNIHSTNWVWANKEVLAKAGVTAAVDKAKADIIAGTIKVHDYTADNTCPVQ